MSRIAHQLRHLICECLYIEWTHQTRATTTYDLPEWPNIESHQRHTRGKGLNRDDAKGLKSRRHHYSKCRSDGLKLLDTVKPAAEQHHVINPLGATVRLHACQILALSYNLHARHALAEPRSDLDYNLS